MAVEPDVGGEGLELHAFGKARVDVIVNMSLWDIEFCDEVSLGELGQGARCLHAYYQGSV